MLSWSFIGDPAMKLPLKVFPAPTPVAQNPQQPASPAETTPQGSHNSSSGCSAFAGTHRNSHQAPWQLIFGFLLEVGLLLLAMRGLGYARVRRSKNRDL